MTPIHIYTDGSSRLNGKPDCTAGWAMAIPDFQGRMFIRYGHLPAPSSNNKGEIMGVLYAMSLFSKQNKFQPIIHSDSQYVIKSCNEWRHNWARSNFSGIKNRNLLVPLFNMLDESTCRQELIWVKGHAGLRGNELADEFCDYGCRQVIMDKNDHISNIKYIDPKDLPYDYLSP